MRNGIKAGDQKSSRMQSKMNFSRMSSSSHESKVRIKAIGKFSQNSVSQVPSTCYKIYKKTKMFLYRQLQKT